MARGDKQCLESRLLMVCLRLSAVKNNCSTRIHTRSRRQKASIHSLEHAGSPGENLLNLFSRAAFKRPTHLVKIRPCDKWLWCQTFVTGCPDICKKCAATSTWWIGAFILRAASAAENEGTSDVCGIWAAVVLSAQELWTLSWDAGKVKAMPESSESHDVRKSNTCAFIFL